MPILARIPIDQISKGGDKTADCEIRLPMQASDWYSVTEEAEADL